LKIPPTMTEAVTNIGKKRVNPLLSKRLWFIDHEEEFISGLKHDLLLENITNATVSRSQTEVMKAVKSDSIDILVSDYKMPDKDGITFLEEVRKLNSNMILVLYTGAFTCDDEIHIRCNKAKISIHHKTAGIQVLIMTLKRLLRNPVEPISKDETPQVETRISGNTIQLERRGVSNSLEGARLIEPKLKENSELALTEIKKAMENMKILSEFYIKDLENIKNQEATISSSEHTLTIRELIKELRELSPIGVKHIVSLLEAENITKEET
jgi:DNA-binding response OmpR family regulator